MEIDHPTQNSLAGNAFSRLMDEESDGTFFSNNVVAQTSGVNEYGLEVAAQTGVTEETLQDDTLLLNNSNNVLFRHKTKKGRREFGGITEKQESDFNVTLEIIFFILSVNNGNGLSLTDQDKFLKLLKDPRLDLSRLEVDTSRDVTKFVDKFDNLTFGEESIKTISVPYGKQNKESNVVIRDAGEALKLIVHENFSREDFVSEAAIEVNEDQKRVYSTPQTGNWWIEIQRMLRSDTGNANAIVLPLILYSDSTTLTQCGNQSAWPVYMTLANIPLHRRTHPGCFQLLGFFPPNTDVEIFSKALQVMLSPLKELSHSGFKVGDVTAYPLFYCYVHDYPEGSKVSGTYGVASCKYPCSSCELPHAQIFHYIPKLKRRTEKKMKDVVGKIRRGLVKCEAVSVHPVDCALWGFRYSDTCVGNVYAGLLVEPLHQSDQGVFRRMIEETAKYIKSNHGAAKLEELDTRMERMSEVGFMSGLSFPKNLWKSGVSVQANEFRAVMQIVPLILKGLVPSNVIMCFVTFWKWYELAVRTREHTDDSLKELGEWGKKLCEQLVECWGGWDMIKVHAISHYKDDIIRSGCPIHYSAEKFENLHQKVCKRPHRGSNKRKSTTDVYLHRRHQKELLLSFMEEFISKPPANDRQTNWDIADNFGTNVLCKKFTSVNISTEVASGNEFIKLMKRAIQEFVILDNKGMPKNVKVFKSCAIGRSSHNEGSAETWVAYANNWHHKIEKYSCVALAGVDKYDNPSTWYARVFGFISFKASNKEYKCAFVKYFKTEGSDLDTGCEKLKWEAHNNLWKLAEIETIYRIVNIVPNFRSNSSEEHFLLNNFLFR